MDKFEEFGHANPVVQIWETEATFPDKTKGVVFYLIQKCNEILHAFLGIGWLIIRFILWYLFAWAVNPFVKSLSGIDLFETENWTFQGRLASFNPVITYVMTNWPWFFWIFGLIFLLSALVRYEPTLVSYVFPWGDRLFYPLNRLYDEYIAKGHKRSMWKIVCLVLFILYYDITVTILSNRADSFYPSWVIHNGLSVGAAIFFGTLWKGGILRAIAWSINFLAAHLIQTNWEYVFLRHDASTIWSQRWTLTNTESRVEWVSICFFVIGVLLWEFIVSLMPALHYKRWAGWWAAYYFSIESPMLIYRYIVDSFTPIPTLPPREIKVVSPESPRKHSPPESPLRVIPYTPNFLNFSPVSWYRYLFGNTFGPVTVWKVVLFTVIIAVILESLKRLLHPTGVFFLNTLIPLGILVGQHLVYGARQGNTNLNIEHRFIDSLTTYLPNYAQALGKTFIWTFFSSTIVNALDQTRLFLKEFGHWLREQTNPSTTPHDDATSSAADGILKKVSLEVEDKKASKTVEMKDKTMGWLTENIEPSRAPEKPLIDRNKRSQPSGKRPEDSPPSDDGRKSREPSQNDRDNSAEKASSNGKSKLSNKFDHEASETSSKTPLMDYEFAREQMSKTLAKTAQPPPEYRITSHESPKSEASSTYGVLAGGESNSPTDANQQSVKTISSSSSIDYDLAMKQMKAFLSKYPNPPETTSTVLSKNSQTALADKLLADSKSRNPTKSSQQSIKTILSSSSIDYNLAMKQMKAFLSKYPKPPERRITSTTLSKNSQITPIGKLLADGKGGTPTEFSQESVQPTPSLSLNGFRVMQREMNKLIAKFGLRIPQEKITSSESSKNNQAATADRVLVDGRSEIHISQEEIKTTMHTPQVSTVGYESMEEKFKETLAQIVLKAEDFSLLPLESAILKYGKILQSSIESAAAAASATAFTSLLIPSITSNLGGVKETLTSIEMPLEAEHTIFESEQSAAVTPGNCAVSIQFTMLSILCLVILTLLSRQFLRFLTKSLPNTMELAQAILFWPPLQWTLAFYFAYNEVLIGKYLIGANSLWHSNQPLFFFVLFASFKGIKIGVNAISYHFYSKPLEPIQCLDYSPNDVTVIIIIRKVDDALVMTVQSILETGVAGIIISTIGLDIERDALRATEKYIGRVRVISSIEANKRGEIIKALQYVKTPLVALRKGRASNWPPQIIAASLSPFHDPLVGMVGTSRRVIRTNSLLNYLSALLIEQETYEATATSTIDGSAFKLDGPVRIIRSEILHTLEYRREYLSEIWLGVGPVISDSEEFTTRFVQRKGYKIFFNNREDVKMDVHSQPVDLGAWGERLVKGYRASFRHAFRTLFEDRVCWYAHPWTTYASFLFFFEIPIFYDFVLFLLLWNADVGNICAFLSSLFVGELLRQWPLLRREPWDALWFPVGWISHYLSGFLKLYAVFTTHVDPDETGDPRLLLSGGTGVM